MKTLAAGLAVAFAAWWVISDPVSAAHVIRHLGDHLNTAAIRLRTLLSNI